MAELGSEKSSALNAVLSVGPFPRILGTSLSPRIIQSLTRNNLPGFDGKMFLHKPS